MRTKLFVLLAVMSSLMAMTAQAEVRTGVITDKNPRAFIDIKEGEVAKVLYFKTNSGNDNFGTIYLELDQVRYPIFGFRIGYVSSNNNTKFSGPAKLLFERATSYGPSVHNSAIYSVEITPNETATSKAAGHALVLPEGEGGKQKLVLESSTDLVSWSEDSLGSKDSSDKKRFYRLRAVKE